MRSPMRSTRGFRGLKARISNARVYGIGCNSDGYCSMQVKDLSPEVVRRLWWFDDSVNRLRWLERAHGRPYGKMAGVVDDTSGYDRIRVSHMGKLYVHARLVYIYHFGSIESGMMIDHIDGNTMNDAPSNLQQIPNSNNVMRSFKRQVANPTSRYRGVSITKHNKWSAYIKVGGKKLMLGNYWDESVAAAVYEFARRRILKGAYSPPPYADDLPDVPERFYDRASWKYIEERF